MKRYLLLLIICTWYMNAFAEMPVIDVAALTKLTTEISDLEQQIHQLDNLYANAQSQLTQQTQLVGNTQGHYTYGNLYNSSQDLQHREWQPSDWQSALKGLSGGNPERYQELVTAYQQQHPTVVSTTYSQGASPTRTTLHEQMTQLNQVASVQSTYAYDEINEHFNTVHQLSQQIEQAPNAKSIADLQARLLTEIAYIEMACLRMQTLTNQQLAQRSINDMTEDEAAAQFNTLPNS